MMGARVDEHQYNRGLAVGEQERQRLELQGDLYSYLAAWTFDALALQPGRRVLELGCGTGNLLAVAAEHVGPTGRVVGVDRDPGLVAQARERVRPFPWVEVVEADARAYPGEATPFDAVHCRLVMLHQPDADAFLAHMATLTRPGGRVAAQELDVVDPAASGCFPPIAAYEALHRASVAAITQEGMDSQSGRHLLDRFARLGFADLRTEGYIPFIPFTHPRLTVMLDGVAKWGAIAERTGVLSQARYDALVAEVRALHHDPAYGNHLARLAALIAVVGTKPGGAEPGPTQA